MNNREREWLLTTRLSLWIDNDEGLYLWWKRSKQSKRVFIRENREELDRIIAKRLGRTKEGEN